MSELDGVKRLVEQARESVDTAKVAGEAAQQLAGDKMNELAMLGLEGVAQGVNTVADAMATAVGQLGVAFGSADEAVSGLADVTDGTRVSVTVAALAAAGEKLGNAGTEVAGAGANVDEALATAQHTEVEPVEVAVTQAASAIGEAVSSIETARAKAEAHRQQVQQSAETLSGGSGSGIVAHTGDQLQPPGLGTDKPNPHKTELFGADDDDKSKSRLERLSRAMVRNAENFHKSSKDYAGPAATLVSDGYDPHDYGSGTHATVDANRSTPTIGASSDTPGVPDAVATGVVLGVVAVKAVNRWLTRKDRRNAR